MALQDDLRASLIKQFPADVVIIKENNGTEYYACPTCKRPVAMGKDKCSSCDQVLKWDNIKEEEIKTVGVKTASLTFEVAGDFVKGDCRKCPLSYISRRDGENVYDCPLNLRNSCPLTFDK